MTPEQRPGGGRRARAARDDVPAVVRAAEPQPQDRRDHSHNISAFGDVSFVEAAVFLVAVGVVVMLLARAEGRDFHLPGGDGTIVTIAGGWAALLIFYRVFDRPAGHGYPVGIEWGFFLAFVAAGCLAYAGWRMRAAERPEPPLTRAPRAGARAPRPSRRRPSEPAAAAPDDSRENGSPPPEEEVTVVAPARARTGQLRPGSGARAPPLPARPARAALLRGPAARPERPARRGLASARGPIIALTMPTRPRRPGLRRRRRRGPARGRLPARRVDRAGLLPGDQARQARARRGPRRRRQDRARQGARRLPRPRARAPAVLRGPRRGEGAVRVELPQAAAAHPGRGLGHRLGRRPGGHLRRGVPAGAAADDARSPPSSRSCC